uniref:Uncharacterized protein n=1 Tax=Melopsittacus undulatus TaxID=13146 RepID=A0A8C6JVR1_MELUD
MSPQVLCGAVVGLLAPPAPPTLAPALLQALAVFSISWCSSTALSPCCSPWCPPQDLLRAVSGTIIFLVVALVALAASRDALAATTFVSVILILSFLFAFDAFVTYRVEVAPAGQQWGHSSSYSSWAGVREEMVSEGMAGGCSQAAVGQKEGVPPWLQCCRPWPAAC